jgi:uncharacterized protein (DUF952 family)
VRLSEESGEQEVGWNDRVDRKVLTEEALRSPRTFVVELGGERCIRSPRSDQRAMNGDGFVGEEVAHHGDGYCAHTVRRLPGAVGVGVLPPDGRTHESEPIAVLAVEGALGDVRIGGDAVERHRVVPLGCEDRDDQIDDPFVALGLFSGGGASAFSGHGSSLAFNATHSFHLGGALSSQIHHIAIQDDWEMSRGFGEYVVSTRGTHLDDAGFIHATTGGRVAEVVERRFGDLDLPLLDIAIDVEALEAAGVRVEWVEGAPRILGELPMSAEVITAETPIVR